MTAVKKCPFCGGTNLGVSVGLEDREGVPTNAYCDDCGAQGPWVYLDPSLSKQKGNMEFVADATGWNSRISNDYESVMDVLTSTQAAELLGVSSSNTVKNWLHGGHFPGAYKAADGHWRFPLEEVEAVRSRLSLLHERNSRRDLMPDDYDNDVANIPFS